MYGTGTSYAYGYCTEAQTKIVFLTKPACGHTHFWLFPWDRFEGMQISAFYQQDLQGHI
jgi:hypothetical protein